MSKTKPKSAGFGNIPNPLETLNNLGKDTAGLMKSEAGNIATDFVDQLFGINIKGKISGEIMPGATIDMKDVLSGKKDVVNAKKEIFFERTLLEEERALVNKKTNELRMQLKVLQEEMIITTQELGGLAKETQIAAMQAPIEPGVYHLIFFQKLLGYIKSFKTKIENATNWLGSANTRAAKKNSWAANYKKHGAKYLLSQEHYVARSAG